MEDPHFLCAFLHRRYHVESISYTALLTDSAPAFNRGDDGIAGNDDKDDDEAIDDDYYCFICLLANAWSAQPLVVFSFPGLMVDTLVELQDIISLDSYTCNFRLTLKQMDKKLNFHI